MTERRAELAELIEEEAPTMLHAKRRPCLMCGTAFDSAWSGERVCPRCKGKPVWREGAH
jgi:hypothetical protein